MFAEGVKRKKSMRKSANEFERESASWDTLILFRLGSWVSSSLDTRVEGGKGGGSSGGQSRTKENERGGKKERLCVLTHLVD